LPAITSRPPKRDAVVNPILLKDWPEFETTPLNPDPLLRAVVIALLVDNGDAILVRGRRRPISAPVL
jgi:hypothetical protein